MDCLKCLSSCSIKGITDMIYKTANTKVEDGLLEQPIKYRMKYTMTWQHIFRLCRIRMSSRKRAMLYQRGMRRTCPYVATTRDEGNAADGRFSAACQERVCTFLMPNLTVLINAFFENLMNGRDPNEVMFNRTGCFDVGHACGGWGHVTVEMRAELRWPAPPFFIFTITNTKLYLGWSYQIVKYGLKACISPISYFSFFDRRLSLLINVLI